MRFIRYASIANIDMARELNTPEYEYSKHIPGWVVTEKIDGANIGLYFRKGEPMRIANRNKILESGERFYNIFRQAEEQLSDLQKCIFALMEQDIGGVQVTLHGEYFGRRVMNRIQYGVDYAFRFFGMTVLYRDGKMQAQPFRLFRAVMRGMGFENLVVPVLGTFESFEEACAYPNDGPTRLVSGMDHGITMEGVVLAPECLSPHQRVGNLMFKNKNEAFMESTARTFHGEVFSEEQKMISDLRERFQAYCTKNRMHTVFSKEGMPSSKKDTGRYIAAFIEDAWEDFLKDNPGVEENLTPAQKKAVKNIGSEGYLLYCKVLSELEKQSKYL